MLRLTQSAPDPGQQFVEAGLRDIGDTAEDVGEPGFGIDVVELGDDDQREHEGGALAAAVFNGCVVTTS